ncbi:uncharacterized protein LOC129595680 [Paramacrobiotus metropolitanus]|uniref:uncharacterized protein LOC129595680 n=1 Tax=Paramacrobiotus metropolitanus TaxID=2943436 RepID=UPI0024457552|nr:uncharacterized protein LOC129595680 [Paramacrobiotus metropolitanus]
MKVRGSQRRSRRLAQNAIVYHSAAETARDDRQSPEFPEPKTMPTDSRPDERQQWQHVPRKTTDQQRKMIYTMFQQGISGQTIASRAGVTDHLVYRELVLIGETLSQRGGRKRDSRVTLAKQQLIIQLFNENVNILKIARRVDHCARTVSNELYLAGKDVRQRHLQQLRIAWKRRAARDHVSRLHGKTTQRTRPPLRGKPSPNEDTAAVETFPVNSDVRTDYHSESVIKTEDTSDDNGSTGQPTHQYEAKNNSTEDLKPTFKEIIISCHGSADQHRYRCNACHFLSDVEQHLVSHFFSQDHQRQARNAHLVCADCRFRSSQTVKMVRHCLKHSASAPHH